MIAPAVIAHADWGTDRRKRQVAMARLVPGGACLCPRYLVVSLGPAPYGLGPEGDLFHVLRAAASPGQAMAGFDFPIGLPRAYAKAAGISSFPEFLAAAHPRGRSSVSLPAAPARLRCAGRFIRMRPAEPGANICILGSGSPPLSCGAVARVRTPGRCSGRSAANRSAREPSPDGSSLPPRGTGSQASHCGHSPGLCPGCSTAAAALWSWKPTRVSITSTSGLRAPRPRGGASDGERTG